MTVVVVVLVGTPLGYRSDEQNAEAVDIPCKILYARGTSHVCGAASTSAVTSTKAPNKTLIEQPCIMIFNEIQKHAQTRNAELEEAVHERKTAKPSGNVKLFWVSQSSLTSVRSLVCQEMENLKPVTLEPASHQGFCGPFWTFRTILWLLLDSHTLQATHSRSS